MPFPKAPSPPPIDCRELDRLLGLFLDGHAPAISLCSREMSMPAAIRDEGNRPAATLPARFHSRAAARRAAMTARTGVAKCSAAAAQRCLTLPPPSPRIPLALHEHRDTRMLMISLDYAAAGRRSHAAGLAPLRSVYFMRGGCYLPQCRQSLPRAMPIE